MKKLKKLHRSTIIFFFIVSSLFLYEILFFTSPKILLTFIEIFTLDEMTIVGIALMNIFCVPFILLAAFGLLEELISEDLAKN